MMRRTESQRFSGTIRLVTVPALLLWAGSVAQAQPAAPPPGAPEAPGISAPAPAEAPTPVAQPVGVPEAPPPPVAPPPPPDPPAPPAPPVPLAPPAALAPPAPEPPAAEAAVVAPAEEKTEELVVTGSRLRRLDLVTPAPVSVLTRQELEYAGVTSIGQILQNLTSQSNAINVQFNNGGDGSTRVNLRGLGSGRTLVLLNGRRFVAGGTGADSSVDLNSIPASIVERVEVLKDGASAVYGSDAIGGVINIITKKDFAGVEGDIYFGAGQHGGTFTDISVTAGETTDRANFIISFNRYEQTSLMADARDFAKTDKDYVYTEPECVIQCKYDPQCIQQDPTCAKQPRKGATTTAGSSAVPQGYLRDWEDGAELEPGVPDPLYEGNDKWKALVKRAKDQGSPLAFFNDPQDGWRPFNSAGTRDSGEGDLYNYQPFNYLVTPSQRYSVFALGHYELSKYIRPYFEASYTNRRSDQLLAPEPLFTSTEGVPVSKDNYYNPFGRDFSDIRRRLDEAGGRKFIQDIDTFRAVLGVDGKLPVGLGVLSDWRWDLSYVFGRTEGTNVNEGRLIRSRLRTAIGPSFKDENGVIQCGTPDNPDPNWDGCVPLDLFSGQGSITPEMIKYLTYTGIARGYSQQQIASADFAGPLFELLGRDVGLALGYQYRAEEGAYTPDPMTASGNTTGNKEEPTGGDYDVHAAYAELSLPLAFNLPGLKLVELTAAGRFVAYSSFGAETTWKGGLRWQVLDHFALRGTASRAFRAPSVAELYLGQTESFESVDDPCDTESHNLSEAQKANCKADGIPETFVPGQSQYRTLWGGNEDLEPEQANTFTAGLVVTPKIQNKFVDGLTLTVDLFNIEIENAIQAAGANIILAKCYDSTNRSDYYCQRIHRKAGLNPSIDYIEDTLANIGGNETSGIDFGLGYNLPLGQHKLNFDYESTLLLKYDELRPDGSTIEGKGVYDIGAFPEWRHNITLAYTYKEITAGVNLHYIGSFKECEGDSCTPVDSFDEEGNPIVDAQGNPVKVNPPSREIDSWMSWDIFASYKVSTSLGMTSISLGMNNILDQDPPFIDNGFLANSDASTYDYVGRYFYVNLTQSL